MVNPAIEVSFGNGGWICAVTSSLPDHVAWVRLADAGHGYRSVEVFVLGRGGAPVDADVLRAIPLARIETVVNVNRVDLESRMQLPAPQLATAARHYATSFGSEAESTWVTEMFDSQMEDFTGHRPNEPRLERRSGKPKELALEKARLDIPPGRKRGDNFYRQVADVYRFLAPRSRAVNKLIAEANGVPKTTVDRWVRECRKRGFLPATRQGSVTA
ncbi:MAG: hypothetical protein RIB98_16340 [Acidimicrobiales bacterium]